MRMRNLTRAENVGKAMNRVSRLITLLACFFTVLSHLTSSKVLSSGGQSGSGKLCRDWIVSFVYIRIV